MLVSAILVSYIRYNYQNQNSVTHIHKSSPTLSHQHSLVTNITVAQFLISMILLTKFTFKVMKL